MGAKNTSEKTVIHQKLSNINYSKYLYSLYVTLFILMGFLFMQSCDNDTNISANISTKEEIVKLAEKYSISIEFTEDKSSQDSILSLSLEELEVLFSDIKNLREKVVTKSILQLDNNGQVQSFSTKDFLSSTLKNTSYTLSTWFYNLTSFTVIITEQNGQYKISSFLDGITLWEYEQLDSTHSLSGSDLTFHITGQACLEINCICLTIHCYEPIQANGILNLTTSKGILSVTSSK